MTPVCTFVHPCACPHAEQPLFNSEYKRTNRTRATKIVRCFPHCCPTHRPRSYCGSALYVDVTSSGEDITWDRLVVFGRFEQHQPDADDDTEPIDLGDRIPSSQILNAPSNESVWVKGEQDVDEGAAERTRQYALRGSADGFGHWEYDWKSGTSQQQRSTPHHFRVYVFLKSEDEFEVVSMTTSSAFTFAVYRKHQHDPTLTNAPKESRTTEGEGDAEEALTKEDGVANEDEIDDWNGAEGDENEDVALSGEARRDLLWHHRHRGAAKTTTNLALFLWLAKDAEPGWLLKHSRSVYSLLQMASSQDEREDAAPEHVLLHYVTHCIPQLINLLPQRQAVAHTSTDALRRHQVEGKQATTMATCIELLCYLLDPAQATPMLAFVSAHAYLPSSVDDPERQRQVFLQWIDMVANQVESFLQSRGSSTESFVDEVVTVALLRRTRSQREVRELLRNTRVLGQSSFDVLFTRLRSSSPMIQVPGVPHQANERRNLWVGRWICRAFERTDSRDGIVLMPSTPQRRHSWPLADRGNSDEVEAPAPHPHGLLSTLAVVLAAFGFDLTVLQNSDGAESRLRIRPVATVTPSQGNCEFELDGSYHIATEATPLAISSLLNMSAATKKAYYRAYVAPGIEQSTGEDIELEFVVVSTRENDPTVRLGLRFAQPSIGSNASSLITQRRRMNVYVHIECAESLRSDHCVATEEPDVGRFDDAVEASVAIKEHVASIRRWHTSAAFKSVYYAID